MKTNFWQSEEGAVTVDWGVLTATVIGISIATTAAVRQGTDDLSADISHLLAGMITLPEEEAAWVPIGLDKEAVASGREWMAGFADHQLMGHLDKLEPYKDAAQGTGYPATSYHDEYYIARDEALKRGLI